MVVEILKSFAIGICASVPLGPVAIVVMQKSLSYGQKAGFIAGLGATTVDTTYAIISIFALAIAQNFISTYQTFIYFVGGLIVALIGASIAFRNPFKKMKANETIRGASIKDYLQVVVMSLSNPGAILAMFALFAFFGMNFDSGQGVKNVFPVILAVACGSASYWLFFSWLFSHWRKSLRIGTLVWVNRVFGIIVLIIGISLIGQGLYEVAFVRMK
jgi:threonine/homoserine/homoserine lactone efflux protein